MKIFTLTVTAIAFSFTASAQIQKGSVLLGGSVGMSRSTEKNPDDKSKSTTVYLSPSVGKFYKTNRMAGVRLTYYRSSYSAKVRNSYSYGGGLFLRQYQPLGKSFYVFAEEGASATFGKYNSYSGIINPNYLQRVRNSYASLYFGPGVTYSVTPRFQLEVQLPQIVSLDYAHTKTTDVIAVPERVTKNNSVSLNSGFNQFSLDYLSFGLRWLL